MTETHVDPLTPVLTKRWLSPKSWRLATRARALIPP